ncbi:hypothetical protein PISMIDRAFT_9624 [Pisolithus microcarpus 441]|uniref:Uncharacterized protein n=1 Tax=Pisolithus microcarpus 441 TaxID=765257 RepID=A0A0C9Z7W3_9AGAM|nr:hypothetical protein PISMIDRAFT_9624 [Pisolithus microcarpus 441]
MSGSHGLSEVGGSVVGSGTSPGADAHHNDTGETLPMHTDLDLTTMNIADNLEANVIDGVAANNVNDIHIEYHPNATIPPQEIPFAKFARGHRPRAYKPDMSTDPWYPFRSHLDFEFAELALEVALNKEQVNHLLHLMKSIHSAGKAFTLNEYNDLQSTWQATSHRMTAFTKEVVCINSMDGEPQEFTMYYCSLWDWVCGLLKHPSIGLHFVFDVQHLSKFDGLSFIRFIDELWMANEFWNIQSQLPPNGKVLPFILYADKVKLLSFGQQKGYPIVTRLANLPVSIQNGEGIGGGCVIGWLPIVKETKEHSGKTWFANFKNAVWHESFRKLLQTIEKESQVGCWVSCWDGIPHHFFPIVLILSADYEEQAVMALIHGIKSNFPCPICLIPHDHISDFPAQCELWTSKNILKVLEDACSQDTQEKKEQILIQQGLRDVDSAFMVVANTDVYHALSWDQLHANFSGKFGDHLWAELLRILDKAGLQTMAMVEKNMMPRWHTLNHFDKALSISYTDGQKFEDLSKNTEKEGYLLLCCLRAYIEFDLYTVLELHTTHMIAAGQEALSTFNALMQKYAQKTDNTKKNWNFPKNHTRMHAFDNIEAKGEKYQKHTNFKNVAQQILDVNHLEAVLELIRCRISDYDEDFFHVRLGSGVKQPLALGAIKQRSTTDKAFMQFWAKLNELLNRHFEIMGKPPYPSTPSLFTMREQHDEAPATDALDLIWSVIQDQPGLLEEALEVGDVSSTTDLHPPDLVQLMTMILEEALNHSQAGREASGE